MTDEDNAKLAELNAAVDKAILDRSNWLDSKMSQYSELQIGDEVYNYETGLCEGKVTRLYRYWGPERSGRLKSDGIFDRSMHVYYEFSNNKGWIDNSSRQEFKVGSKEQALRRLNFKMKTLCEQ